MFDDFTLQSHRQVPGPDRLFLGPGCGPGGTYLVLRRLPAHWTAKLALVLALFGGFLALGPIGLLVR
ncbi:MAG: hypothetical protein NTW83_09680 [Cyanobacteria bacterium]|nr:hypothetical protein [Cyanobacteriota bacterium]